MSGVDNCQQWIKERVSIDGLVPRLAQCIAMSKNLHQD